MKKTMVAAMTSLSVFLAGCGLGTGGGYTPSGQLTEKYSGIDLDGLKVSVGSKNFTEQIILGKLAVLLLASAGADVDDLTNIPGSTSARQAQVKGDIDMMYEYTGTAWITYFGETDPIPDEEEQYATVRDRDRKENDLRWLPPAPMNNTYGMAVTEETAERYGIESLGDLAKLPKEEQTYCLDAEFKARNDGFGPMVEEYDLPPVAEDQIATLDSGVLYEGLADGACRAGEVFKTDGRVPALDLKVLDDPKNYFPKYNVAPVIRGEVVDRYPQIAKLFEPIAEDLTNERMQQLNARADIDGEDYAKVARDYLVELGVLTG